ncbi:MAG: hypothetical protein EP335_12350 [Alphaproteobacteria bacterium]|nr:MAG: hypothetical protein EP335_12350 [Alphaproteobacteria bacterium]
MKQLIVHMGAHRCASSAVQALLRRNRATLEAAGVALFLRADMEEADARVDARGLFRASWRNPTALWRAHRFRQAVMALPHDRIVISEENLIGTMPGQYDGLFYPGFSRFLNALVPLGAQLDLVPRMIVRRQDRFVQSAYAFRVAFGLAQAFPAFVKDLDLQGLSWLRLATGVDRTGLADRFRFQPLEAWPRAEAAARASAFLGLADVLPAADETLKGNASFPEDDLRLMLSLNRAGLGLDIMWRREKLFRALRNRDGESDMDILQACGLKLDRAARQALEGALASPPALTMDSDLRAWMVAHYRDENRAFLSHTTVAADPSLWEDRADG